MWKLATIILGIGFAATALAGDSKTFTLAADLECLGAPGNCTGAKLAGRGPAGCTSRSDEGPKMALRRIAPNAPLFEALDQSGRRQFRQVNTRDMGEWRRLHLPEAPKWTQSAAWDLAEQSVLVVDNIDKALVEYSEAGDLFGRLYPSRFSTGQRISPKSIYRTKDGFALKLEKLHFVVLDGGYRLVHEFDLEGLGDDRRGRIARVLSWVADSESLLALVDLLERRSESYVSAVVRIPIAEPMDFVVLETLSIDSSTRNYARLGYPVISSSKRGSFLLRLDGGTALECLDCENRMLHSRSLEELDAQAPLFTREDELVDMYGRFELSTMPVAIYSWEDRLFVLVRRSNGAAPLASWEISRIDTDLGVVVSTVPLGVTAAHVIVVPGVRQWAIVEKMSVEGLGEQKTPAIVFVDSDRFREGEDRAENRAEVEYPNPTGKMLARNGAAGHSR